MACNKLTDGRMGEPFEKARARLEGTREKLRLRFVNTGLASNAHTRSGAADARVSFRLDEAGTSLRRTAMSHLRLPAQGFQRGFKLARTIADLAGSENIWPPHLAAAIRYRRGDRISV